MPTFSQRILVREMKRSIREKTMPPKVKDYWRPKTYGDCANGPRPCPFVGCKYNLYLDASHTGSLKMLNGEVEDNPCNCALDIANEGGKTLEEIAKLLGVTRERVRQIELMALEKLSLAYPELKSSLKTLMALNMQDETGYQVHTKQKVMPEIRRADDAAEFSSVFKTAEKEGTDANKERARTPGAQAIPRNGSFRRAG